MSLQSAPASSLTKQTTAALIVMVVIDSFHLIFARSLASIMSPYTSAFYVLGTACLVLALYFGLRRRIRPSVFLSHPWFFLGIGFLIAASTVCGYTAVKFIDAGTASLLERTSTIITLALSYFWLKEKLSKQELTGALLCILGAFVISFQGGNVMRAGSLLILVSVIFYALHIAIVKRYGEGIEFENFFFFRVLSTSVFLAIFMGSSGNLGLPPSLYSWLLLAFIGTVDVVISRLLYYWALRRMRLGIHTLVLTLTPVLTILWSILIFRESPSWQGVAGGVLILIGILIVGRAQQRRVKKSRA